MFLTYNSDPYMKEVFFLLNIAVRYFLFIQAYSFLYAVYGSRHLKPNLQPTNFQVTKAYNGLGRIDYKLLGLILYKINVSNPS